jgi:hypothetical protein
MDEMESPTCVPILPHPSNCVNIANAMSDEVIRVRVRPKDETTKKLIEAVGTLSNDGKSFSVVVTREDGA